MRSGVALEGQFQARSFFGRTCASRISAAYSGASRFAPRASMRASPPWQSVQPRITAGFWCMVWRSVAVWQLMQPADFASACATVCVAGAGGNAAMAAFIATADSTMRIGRIRRSRPD